MGLLEDLFKLGKIVVTGMDAVRQVRDMTENPDCPQCPRCKSRRTSRMNASARARQINAGLRVIQNSERTRASTLEPLPNSGRNPVVNAPPVSEPWICSDCNHVFDVSASR